MAQDIVKDILNEFDAHSKADWEAQALKDLKGAPLEKLNWSINEDIQQAAFYSESDLPALDHSVLKDHNPDWQIGEHYFVEDYKASNAILLADLMHGLNAPSFSFKQTPSASDLAVLFNNVGLEHISVQFEQEDNALFLAWTEFLKEKNLSKVAAFFNLENALTNTTKSLLVDARTMYQGTSNIHKEIEQALLSSKVLIQNASDKSLTANRLHFKFYVDNSYMASVAKLRAFKLLYVDLLKSLSLTPQLPFISVELAPEAYGEDPQDNLINATAMSMSAVFGGANHLIVRPTEETATAKRLARNVQLILKHESGLHKVADPAQGSYYIESLTSKLVNWCKK